MKRSPLKINPVKVAAFKQRGRGNLKRTAKPKPQLPGQRGWTRRVFALYGDRCVACGDRAVHAHHAVGRAVILAARHLTEDERRHLAYAPENGAPVCLFCHHAHETAAKRIPYHRLPAGVIVWAREHGFATRIADERVYPRGGW